MCIYVLCVSCILWIVLVLLCILVESSTQSTWIVYIVVFHLHASYYVTSGLFSHFVPQRSDENSSTLLWTIELELEAWYVSSLKRFLFFFKNTFFSGRTRRWRRRLWKNSFHNHIKVTCLIYQNTLESIASIVRYDELCVLIETIMDLTV